MKKRLFRLSTDHYGLNKHLKKMGVAEFAQCQCGATEQTPVHILQTCPHIEGARLQVWPTEAPVSEKLLGSGDDLLKTTNFVHLTGLWTIDIVQPRKIEQQKKKKKKLVLPGSFKKAIMFVYYKRQPRNRSSLSPSEPFKAQR